MILRMINPYCEEIYDVEEDEKYYKEQKRNLELGYIQAIDFTVTNYIKSVAGGNERDIRDIKIKSLSIHPAQWAMVQIY